MSEVVLAVASAGSPPAQEAMRAYFAELARRIPSGFDPGNALEQAAAQFRPPHGVFVVALLHGEVVGCGGIQHLDDETAEIKRMWVSPRTRGVGVGKRLLARLEQEARRAGRRRVVLDSNASLKEALALYQGQGYVPVARYNDNPYAQRWFAKALTAPDGDA